MQCRIALWTCPCACWALFLLSLVALQGHNDRWLHAHGRIGLQSLKRLTQSGHSNFNVIAYLTLTARLPSVHAAATWCCRPCLRVTACCSMLALALLQSTYTGSCRPCSGVHLNTWLVAQATLEIGALWVQAVLASAAGGTNKE
jgi:hypothetical protein